MKIGFIGLGSMGLSMALNLLRYTQNFVYDMKHWNDRKEEAQ